MEKSLELEKHLDLIKSSDHLSREAKDEFAGPSFDINVYQALELLDQFNDIQRRASLFRKRQLERQYLLQTGEDESQFIDIAKFEDVVQECMDDLMTCFEDLRA